MFAQECVQSRGTTFLCSCYNQIWTLAPRIPSRSVETSLRVRRHGSVDELWRRRDLICSGSRLCQASLSCIFSRQPSILPIWSVLSLMTSPHEIMRHGIDQRQEGQ